MTWTKRLQIENKRLSFCRAYSVGWVVFFNFSQKLHVEKALAQFQSHFKFSKMYKKWLLTFVYRWAGCPTDTIEQGFVVLNLICVRKLMGPNDSAKFKSLASILNILNRSVITKFSEHQFQRTKCHKSPIQECNNTLFANSQLRWNVYSNKKHVHTNKSLSVSFLLEKLNYSKYDCMLNCERVGWMGKLLLRMAIKTRLRHHRVWYLISLFEARLSPAPI